MPLVIVLSIDSHEEGIPSGLGIIHSQHYIAHSEQVYLPVYAAVTTQHDWTIYLSDWKYKITCHGIGSFLVLSPVTFQ